VLNKFLYKKAKKMIITANFVDIHNREIYPASVDIEDGRIASVKKADATPEVYMLPGFIDAHVHIESSMVTPVAFAYQAVKHGTVGVVTDPHEIANVLGEAGVDFMIENGELTPLKIMFGAPSCVPATGFESSGARIDVASINALLDRKGIGYLSEMMNFPGVIHNDAEVLKKIEIAREKGLPVDGHAPGLIGDDLKRYVDAGISTDHECFSLEEAEEKIEAGMKILIREGSGAKNYKALRPLIKSHPGKIMFCTDDLHPDDLLEGHINKLVFRAIKEGYNLYDVLRAASRNAVEHYQLETGLLREGDPADFILIDSFEQGNIIATYINGEKVFSEGRTHFDQVQSGTPNHFETGKISTADLQVSARGILLRTIEAIDGELITKSKTMKALIKDGFVIPDPERDLLKIVVVNRYRQCDPSVAFIHGFGLKQGALVSSIGHDSHNIICVGASDEAIAEAINWVIDHKGGIAMHDGEKVLGLPLEIAGIISVKTVKEAAEKYKELSKNAKVLGSGLTAPFMTLAFMSLLVIPELKLSDQGLFDGSNFSFTSLFIDSDEYRL